MYEFALHRTPLSKTTLRLTLCLFLAGVTGMAAAKPDNITEAELKLLPRFCRDTQTFGYGDANFNRSPRAGHWVSLMGNTFWAMHHYCWAQINMNRSRKSGLTAQARRGLWESVRGDYGYVINNAPPDFIMLPDIYTRVGEVELLLDHPDKANEAFAHARELKPDYWPAYSHWAEFLIKIGRRPDALKLVTSGLEHSPDAKVLLEQFRVLGGKPSDIPKPSVKPAEDPLTTEAPLTTPGKPNSPGTPADEK